MLILYRIIYVLSSVALLVPICLVNHYKEMVDPVYWLSCHWTIFFVILITFPFILTCALFKDSKYLQKQEIGSERVKSVRSAASDQFPVAIGYIFIALSINNYYTLCICLILLSIVCYYTPAYFNICMYIFGYRYYYVTTIDNIEILVPTRRNIGLGDKPSFMKLRRVNNLTFIDIQK